MEELEIDFSWSQERLEEEMDKVNVLPAKSSSLDYYNQKKGDSYPLNLNSDIRGRAVVFVMSQGRPGWQQEVWDLYKMFNGICTKCSSL